MRAYACTLLFCAIVQAHALDLKEQAAQALERKDAPAAAQLLSQAVAQEPHNFSLLMQLATAHFLSHQYEKAATYFGQAVAHNPRHIQALFNCATAHSKCGHFQTALSFYEKVFEQYQAENVKNVLYKMYIRCRKWHKAQAIRPPQLWWYTSSIYNKTIALDCCKPGNGLGDVIQFIRYAKRVSQAGAHVIVKAPEALHPLLQRASYINRLYGPEEELPHSDHLFDICIASLLAVSYEQFEMNAPQESYLTADPYLVSEWKKRLAQDSNYKIGLCWKSNVVRDRFTGAIMPSPRSVPLEALATLADHRCSFYSLHKQSQTVEGPLAITQFCNDFDESHGRFMDTAALIANMDLIITVDTSIAHLAGALGKPVYLLLSCESDYRWFTDTNSTPLYPNMRLFRQTTFGEWDTVITRIARDLSALTPTAHTQSC